MTGANWVEWHEAYGRQGSGLRDRLATVQSQVVRRLDDTTPEPVRVVSACAGDGRDLLEVLAGRDDAARVNALLVEQDGELARRAETAARALPADIEVPSSLQSRRRSGRSGCTGTLAHQPTSSVAGSGSASSPKHSHHSLVFR